MPNTTTKSFNVVKINTDFTMASTKTNITSGENLMVSLGKIAKWYDATNGFASSSESSTNKNLIPTYIQTPLTKNGITFTLEDDYSITANGTAASTTRVITGECTLPAGQYESWAWVTTDGTRIFGSDSTFLVELTYYDETNAQWVFFNPNPSYIGRGNGYLVALEESTRIRMTIIIYQGYVASNLNFKIVTATYNGDLRPFNYEPHIPSNEDLAKHITTLGSAAYIDSDNLVLGNVSHVSGSGNVISNIDFQQNLLGPGKVIEITKDNAIMRSDIPTSPTTGTNGWYNCRYSDSKIQYHVPDLSSYALTSDLSSYIPLSGSSSITGSLIPSVNGSYDLGSYVRTWKDCYFKYVNTESLYDVNGTPNGTITAHANIVPNTTNSESHNLGGATTSAWNYTYTNYLVAYSSIKHCVPSSGGWSRGINYSDYTNSSTLGIIGAYGSSSTLSYYFIGNSYSDADHLVRIDNDGTGKMTLVGTLPQLNFRQTTSGSGYSNPNAGIKCYPSGSKDVGMNMVIQSSGNMIIGGGEFPTNFYNATKFTGESYTASGEQIYIGSDSNVYVITNAQTTVNRKVFTFGSNFNLAAGGKLVFRYGDNDSYTNHSLTSEATTTARTWTLPDEGGTVALTSDIPTVSISRNLTSGTKVGTITINGTNTDLYCQTNTDEKVKTTAVTSTTDSAAYRPIFSNGSGTASTYISEALKIGHQVGTASAEGNVRLILGNSTAKGTAGNQSGWIRMYGPGTGYVTLAAPNVSSNSYVITLPAATGTIALTSDIPAITATTSSSGSGNAVTAVSLSNGTLTVTKGSSFSLSTHTHYTSAISFTAASGYTLSSKKSYLIEKKFVLIMLTITTTNSISAATLTTVAHNTVATFKTSGYIPSDTVVGYGYMQQSGGGALPVAAWISVSSGTASVKFSTSIAAANSSTKTIKLGFYYPIS